MDTAMLDTGAMVTGRYGSHCKSICPSYEKYHKLGVRRKWNDQFTVVSHRVDNITDYNGLYCLLSRRIASGVECGCDFSCLIIQLNEHIQAATLIS